MDLQHLRASDGTGEAVLAHVSAVRTAGSTVLELDNIDNWNTKCVIVTGTPNANGFIDTAGMTVMYGHITAGDFIIDGFAPGYTDNGNTTTEVAIVKMTTNWADELVDIISTIHNDDGTLKNSIVTLAKLNGGTTAGVLTTDASGVVSTKGNYSTSEVATNTTWIDGKMIYEKTVAIGALPNAASKSVAHNIVTIDRVIDMFGRAYNGTIDVPLPFAATVSASTMQINRNGANLDIITGIDRSAFAGHITLRYTKV